MDIRSDEQPQSECRILARPGESASTAAPPPGLKGIGIGDVEARDGFLYIPEGYNVQRPAPLAVMLHGAGGSAQEGVEFATGIADQNGILILAPDSRGQTWDILLSGCGPDVAFIDRALERAFEQCAVDPARIAIGGFSDGASYALALGIANGDLFTHVLAFSPGFLAPSPRRNAPRIFISHGVRDQVLPIDQCSRRIVPILRDNGYDVTYREFDGAHTVPGEVARDAMAWFTRESAPAVRAIR
jgi:phospholipase/carboxylesterase